MATLRSALRIVERLKARSLAFRFERQTGYVLTDLEGCITDSNRAFQAMVGRTARELSGVSESSLSPSRWHALDAGVLADMVHASHDPEPRDKEYTRSDGTVVPVEVRSFLLRHRGQPVGVWSIVRDITERTRTAELVRLHEERLRSSQRLETVGRLAGAIAHDYNNLLTIILGCADLMGSRLGAGDDRADLEELRRAAERAASMTRQLLAFSRLDRPRPVPSSLSQLIERMRGLLRSLVGAEVTVETCLDPDLPPVLADPGQLTQVIANLVVHAADTMPAGGQILIETTTAAATAGNDASAQQTPGLNVVLSVHSTGPSIDPNLLPHVLEPVRPSVGRGMGLSAIRSIVEHSGGRVTVSSTPGSGQTVTLCYMSTEPCAETAPARPGTDTRVEHPARTVLLAEDDATVRQVVARILEREGYRVVQAGGGREALALADLASSPIDALVSDVGMPGMNGIELAGALRRAHPDLAVVLMSGHPNPERFTAPAGSRLPVTTLVSKPFDPAALLGSIRQALAEQRVSLA